MTNTLSILHRITGMALVGGSALFVLWLWAAAYAPMFYEDLHGFLGSIVGKIMLFGWTVAFYYHLGNGIRHLIWDTGAGMELHQVYRSGKIAIAFTVIMSIATWAMVLMG